jgi:hypothetical protein
MIQLQVDDHESCVEAQMAEVPDLSVRGPDGKILLAVEVKSKPDASQDWAAQMRRNLLVHGFIPPSPFFLLALPDAFYLWRNNIPPYDHEPPDYKINAAEALAAYLNRSPHILSNISEASLRHLVLAWLEDLMSSQLTADMVSPALKPLFESGLYDAIKNGSVLVSIRK